MTDPIVEYLQWKKQGGELRAKANGASTKNLEDRVYELEDDLRLATQ